MKEEFYHALQSGEYYHIYNRRNNRENIFYKEENYIYFLKKYDAYLSEYLDTYAYCLLPNHFHLLVRVKEMEQMQRSTTFLKSGTSTLIDTSTIISELFRRFFTSYAKSINKQESRVGSLFQKNFKRKLISNDSYFISVVDYIHANPQLHGICKDYMEYPHSSYGRIIIDKPTKLRKEELLNWFGGKDEYVKFHLVNKPEVTERGRFVIEEV